MAEQMNCPKCDADISESWQPDEPDVGISSGWYCDACDLAVAGWEHPREPMEGDVEIPPMPPSDKPPGLPISDVSGRWVPENHPDRWRYENFLRIARSWGHN